MKIFINNSTEIDNIGNVSEKKSNINGNDVNVLFIRINDNQQLIEEVEALFQNIESIKVVRTDLNGEEKSIEFTNYTVLFRVERKLTDETDVTEVKLIEDAKYLCKA